MLQDIKAILETADQRGWNEDMLSAVLCWWESARARGWNWKLAPLFGAQISAAAA